MSSDNSQVCHTSGQEEGSSNASQSREPIEVNQNLASASNVNTSQGIELDARHTAASMLMQLQDITYNNQPQGDINNIGSKNGSGEGHSTYHYESVYRSNRGTRNVSIADEEIPTQNTRWQNPLLYSQANMQNTIAGLSNAIGCLQQQQVYMYMRQDNITGTLQQVLTAMRSLRDKSSPTQGHLSSSSVGHGSSESSVGANASTSHLNDETTTGNGFIHNNGRSGGLGEVRTLSDSFQPQPSHMDVSSLGNTQTLSVSLQQHPSYIDTSTLRESQGISDNVRNCQGNTITSALRENQTLSDGVHSYQNNTTASLNGVNQGFSDRVRTYQNYALPGTLGENPTNLDNFQTRHDPAITSVSGQMLPFNCSQERCSQYDKRRQVVQFSDAYNSQDGARNQSYQRPHRSKRQSSPEYFGLKLPPFNGKEDWRVWINRFEAIAERRGWSEETKLDNLLPKLQGKAGDFVFTQLPRGILACYKELVKELNSRFRVVETQKTFAAKFSQRVQRVDETAEEYAADLKRLYAKAYRFRDHKTRQEDLVRRFLDGLRDSEARFEIEFHKEPEDIDAAVYHAVNFIQTRRRSSYDTYAEKKARKHARRTNFEDEGQSEAEELYETDEELDRAYRVPTRSERQHPKNTHQSEPQTEQKQHSSSTTESETIKVLSETKDLIQMLVTQMKEQSLRDPGKKMQGNGRRRVVCYGCQQVGHVLRDCPNKKLEGKGNRGTNEGKQHQHQQEAKEKTHLNWSRLSLGATEKPVQA